MSDETKHLGRVVNIDQWLYVGIAFFGAIGAALASDDAAKFIAPAVLFFSKAISNAIAASLLALKMFRSTAFADYQKKKSDTDFYKKPAP